MTKAADADNAYKTRKTRTKHTENCENSRIFTKGPDIISENTFWKFQQQKK